MSNVWARFFSFLGRQNRRSAPPRQPPWRPDATKRGRQFGPWQKTAISAGWGEYPTPQLRPCCTNGRQGESEHVGNQRGLEHSQAKVFDTPRPKSATIKRAATMRKHHRGPNQSATLARGQHHGYLPFSFASGNATTAVSLQGRRVCCEGPL